MELTSLKVLIADDDEPTRMLLHAAISQWGYEVIEAVDGEDAWNTLQKTKPELLVLDWLMPNLNGIELCKRIRSDAKYRPYIIMLTQIAGTANIITGIEAGADEFLSKPFNIAELHVRMLAGIRILKYEAKFIDQITRLETNSVLAKQTLTQIEKLNGHEPNQIITVVKENLKKMIELGNI